MSPRVCDRNDGYFIWHVLTTKYVTCDAAISNGDDAFIRCADKIWGRNVTSANCGSRGYACRMTTGPSVGGGQLVRCYKDARHWYRFKMSGDSSMVNVPEVTTCMTDKRITGVKRVRLRTTFLRERIELDACALPGGKVAFRMSLTSKWSATVSLTKGSQTIHLVPGRVGRELLAAITPPASGTWRLKVTVLPRQGDQILRLSGNLTVG